MTRRDAVKASSVWPEMPFMRGPKGAERLREWLPEQRRIHEQALRRRARVLAHDWACKRLCHILALTDASHWNGYVPTSHDDQGRINNSAIRHSLVELLREVANADSAEGE